MAIENMELMRECSPEHLSMGTARLKCDKETEEEGKQKKSKNGKKYSCHEKKSPDSSTVARGYRPPGSLLHETMCKPDVKLE